MYNIYHDLYIRGSLRGNIFKNEKVKDLTNMKKIISAIGNIFTFISTALIIYLLICFVQVNAHNGIDDEPMENTYNIFYIITNNNN